ncbi:DUF4916 domain-containing protein [Candidatus Daviesbacteria bacterium]|nr:DUF4916 domain-containing protein [Candidatus Daviesbacteria bacterium]MBI2334528.1 DUF4916 domain-containing protein [Candidatus Daviesbacteria bacterium]MBI3109920.1 DUF4916 domain-containing protein [Candidatus Daviesbacteria bacterium]
MKKTNAWLGEKDYLFITSKTPIPTVDLVVLRQKMKLEVLLVARKTGYAKGLWCIIGGRIWKGETVKDCLERQAKDLGVKVAIYPPFDFNFPALVNDHLNQDKTKQSICNVYPVKISKGEVRYEGEEYKRFGWFPVDQLPKLAFDHEFEVKETVKRFKAI